LPSKLSNGWIRMWLVWIKLKAWDILRRKNGHRWAYRALGAQNDILFSPEVDKDATQLYIPVQSTNYCGTRISMYFPSLKSQSIAFQIQTWGMSGNMFSNYCSVALEVQKGSLSIIIYPYLYDLYEYVMYVYIYICIYICIYIYVYIYMYIYICIW
jgi:hypothetical protein